MSVQCVVRSEGCCDVWNGVRGVVGSGGCCGVKGLLLWSEGVVVVE